MSLGLILIIILVIFLLGGFSGRFGGYGYGYGHGGVGLIGTILIIVLILHAARADMIRPAESPMSRLHTETISSAASAGCERRCSGPTTALSPPQA